MDAALFFQIIGAIVTVGSFFIAIITLKHKFKKEEQVQEKENIKQMEKHLERMNNIERDIADLNRATEQIKKEREQIVKSIYDEIRELRSKHDNDVAIMQNQIKEMIKEIKIKNEDDHKELKEILDKINISLNTVCTRFSDHVGDNNVNHEDQPAAAPGRRRK